MPVAYLPSPTSAVWQLGPIPVRAYALCLVAGVVAGLWLTDRRYRKAGGAAGVILDMATVAVPVGLVGSRIYIVLCDRRLYFGPGTDWVDILRIWDGGLGVAGLVAAGAAGAWWYCRRTGVEIGPIGRAAAPGCAVAQAIAVWGNWFSQQFYGRPSSLPWAVAIGPEHRAVRYQSFSTFQPVFLYQSILDLLVAAGLIYAIRRFSLAGDRAFALYGALYAASRLCTDAIRVDSSPRLFGLRTDQLAMLVVLVAALAYLLAVRTRGSRRSPGRLAGEVRRPASDLLHPWSPDSGTQEPSPPSSAAIAENGLLAGESSGGPAAAGRIVDVDSAADRGLAAGAMPASPVAGESSPGGLAADSSAADGTVTSGTVAAA